MIRYWAVVRTELAREAAVALELAQKGLEVCRLVEVRHIRKSRHVHSKRIVEANILPGKVIALIPDIDFDEVATIPHSKGIARNCDGVPWAIPDYEVDEFAKNIEKLNEQAEIESQPKAKTRKKWHGLKDGLARLLRT